jgi:hypothetical protein
MSGRRNKKSSFSVAADDEMDDIMDDDTIDEFEPHENEPLMSVATKKTQTSHWRRIEEAKERLRLKRELADYDGYLD